jgi:hypothetical protein
MAQITGKSIGSISVQLAVKVKKQGLYKFRLFLAKCFIKLLEKLLNVKFELKVKSADFDLKKGVNNESTK